MSERRALLGGVAMSAAQILKYGLQLIVLPILARLLGPEAFGVVGLAMPFILLANMLSDAGMGVALIRETNPSRDMESTVFWIAVGVGLTMTLLIVLLAWPAAMAFRDPDLAPVLIALSPIMAIGAALSVSNARISRDRRFGVFAVVEMVASLVSAAVGIGAALAGFGVWSLVAQQLSLWVVKALCLLPAARFRPALVCKPSLAARFITFGVHSIGANLADFASKNLAPVLIGRLLGVPAVGYYALGWQVARIPDQVISGPVYLGVFTSVARAQAEGLPTAPVVLKPLRMLVTGLAPVFVGMAAVADLLVRLLLGAKWNAAAPVLAAIAPGSFLLCLYSIVGAALLGLGRPDHQFRLTLALGLAILAGAGTGGLISLTAVAIGVSLGALAMLPIYARALMRSLDVRAGELFSGMGGPFAAALGTGLSVLTVRATAPELPLLAELAILVAVGVAVQAALLTLFCRRQIVEDMRTLMPARIKA